MKPKLLAQVAIILAGVFISAYSWYSFKNQGGAEQGVVSAKQMFKCEKCGVNFELLVTEATQQLRANEGHIKCPSCGAVDTVLQNVPVEVGTNTNEPQESDLGSEAEKTRQQDAETEEQLQEKVPPPKLAPPGIIKRRE